MHRITRVHNRILRTRFDEKLDQILDRDDIADLTKYEPVDNYYISSLMKYCVSKITQERSLSL